jgi:hypothetical protein
MNPIQVPAGQKMTMRATIIRADGRREELGTIYGGNLFQKVGSFLRTKLANARVKQNHASNINP